ncbi:hypothetical protein Pfo_025911 [Paulownia fortunei]|nr:hypothetical protein Pfo_025911 [Paulownia fortunei]
MVEREKTAKQKASLGFSQLLGYEYDETFEFHGCINTSVISPGLRKGRSLDQEEKILVDDSMMNNGLQLLVAACSS